MKAFLDFAFQNTAPLAVGLAGASISTIAQAVEPSATPFWTLCGFGSVIATVLWIMRQQSTQVDKEREFWQHRVDVERTTQAQIIDRLEARLDAMWRDMAHQPGDRSGPPENK